MRRNKKDEERMKRKETEEGREEEGERGRGMVKKDKEKGGRKGEVEWIDRESDFFIFAFYFSFSSSFFFIFFLLVKNNEDTVLITTKMKCEAETDSRLSSYQRMSTTNWNVRKTHP